MSKCCRPSPVYPQPFPERCHPQQWLLPRIIASSREHLRCYETELTLPGCGYTVRALESGPDAPEATLGPCGCQLTLPVTVWLCDPCGRTEQIQAVLQIPCRFPACRQGGSLTAQASVRLIDAGCPCGNRVCIRVEVWAELYLVRLEPCARGGHPEGPRPPYPPPYTPPSSPPWYPQPRW